MSTSNTVPPSVMLVAYRVSPKSDTETLPFPKLLLLPVMFTMRFFSSAQESFVDHGSETRLHSQKLLLEVPKQLGECIFASLSAMSPSW